ncbi:hypothetical protein CYMTET_4940 [Cymbomonas tetramitiformis]|uniref:Uncharacterized protein n=1 Tax=Cymbomonas tetramitiformis TaxID=36881 RepID=A0AAE0H0C7_9CHLO|nr:hypothetical protein CYMTET_4940 [Cymbomonas tetramitiformis]
MPKITENLPGVKTRRIGVTYVPKVANAEFPRDSEFSKYYCCKVMRAPAAINNICNNLTWRKTHPKSWSVQRMKVPTVLFIFCWAMQFKAAAAVTIQDHSDYQACIQNGCSRLYLRDSLTGTVPTQMGALTQLTDLSVQGWVPQPRGAGSQGRGGALGGLRPGPAREEVPRGVERSAALMRSDLTWPRSTEGAHPVVTPVCMRHGVDVYVSGYNSLTGTVPTQMGALTQLQYLALGYNSLMGTVPTQMGALTQLYELDLHRNSLTGTVPTQMGALTQLQYLASGAVRLLHCNLMFSVGAYVCDAVGRLPKPVGAGSHGRGQQGLQGRGGALGGLRPGQAREEVPGGLEQSAALMRSDLTWPRSAEGAHPVVTPGHCWVGEGGTMMVTSGRWGMEETAARYIFDDSLMGTVPTQLGELTQLTYLQRPTPKHATPVGGIYAGPQGPFGCFAAVCCSQSGRMSVMRLDGSQSLSGADPMAVGSRGRWMCALWLLRLLVAAHTETGFLGTGAHNHQSAGVVPILRCTPGSCRDGCPTLEVQGHRAGVVPSEVSDQALQTGITGSGGLAGILDDAMTGPIDGTVLRGLHVGWLLGYYQGRRGYCWVGEGGTMMLTSGRWEMEETAARDLQYNGLTGTVPTQMGALTQLTRLDLYNNSLTGTVPTQMGALTQQNSLYLYDNSLTGTVPTQMGALTQLTRLYLHDNSLTGTVPTQMGALAQLYHL